MTGEVSSLGVAGHPKCMMVANIFISFIGAGILGLPKAFKTAGLLEGSIVMSVVAFLAVRYISHPFAIKYLFISYPLNYAEIL